MGEMLTTKQVAKFLSVNDKMVYSLIAEKGLPAAKEYGGYDLSLTGKMVYPEPAINQEDLLPRKSL